MRIKVRLFCTEVRCRNRMDGRKLMGRESPTIRACPSKCTNGLITDWTACCGGHLVTFGFSDIL